MSPWNLADYEPVEDRLARFWADHPQGRIHTELVNGSHAGESVVMIASIYKNKTDTEPDATGHAQETPGSNPVNKTSWVENCETSAIGRALANLGYAPKGARASREEMQKASRPEAPRKAARAKRNASPTPSAAPPRATIIALHNAARKAHVDDDLRHRITRYLTQGRTASTQDLSDSEAEMITEQLEFYAMNPSGGLKQLEAWESKNPRPETNAHPGPGGENPHDYLTAEELEAAGQTKLDEPAIPG